jgi:hypothetical protein
MENSGGSMFYKKMRGKSQPPSLMGITPESQAKLEVIAPPSAMLEAFKHCKCTNKFQPNKQKLKK